MNVLSLFDGLGGGRIALERAGIQIDNYFASEVDKYAIKVATTNHPDIIELGDVRNWRKWDLPKIDLLIGGTPCQSFSMAGRRNGMSAGNIEVTSLEQYEQLKADGIEFDGQSYLFWEYVAVLRHYKPRLFMLENVHMAKKWEHVITRALNINPVMINSSLVSAQNRKRLYWTNIGAGVDLHGNPYNSIPQPKDKGILLKDVLEDDVTEYIVYSNIYGGFGEDKPREAKNKSVTIRANSGGGSIPSVVSRGKDVVENAMKGRYVDNGATKQVIETRKDDKSNAITTARMDTLVSIRQKSKTVRVGGRQSNDRHEWDSIDDNHSRRLTVLECERLQTLPDNYTAVDGISNTQRYKMIGDGWTIDVVAHIFSFVGSNEL